MRAAGSHCPPLALTENDRRRGKQRRKVGKQRRDGLIWGGDKEREEIKPDHRGKICHKGNAWRVSIFRDWHCNRYSRYDLNYFSIKTLEFRTEQQGEIDGNPQGILLSGSDRTGSLGLTALPWLLTPGPQLGWVVPPVQQMRPATSCLSDLSPDAVILYRFFSFLFVAKMAVPKMTPLTRVFFVRHPRRLSPWGSANNLFSNL